MMQPLIAPPRDSLTAAAVTALIRDTAALEVAAGCELVDLDLHVVEDITDRLVAGEVSRDSFGGTNGLHGSARLSVEGVLDWGSAIVRPYMVLSTPAMSARFNLGAYYTPKPVTDLDIEPVVHQVECLDILDLLNDAVGEAYAIAAGTSYLAAVEQILTERGYSRFVVDQQAAGTVLPTARTWAMEDDVTWLSIVNDLLAAIAYQPIWSDWDGQPRVEPYASPSARGSEWTYDSGLNTSMLTDRRIVEQDLYRAPNRWRFYRSNNLDGPAPVEGDGLFTFQNDFDGPTSVEARKGRIITKKVPLDVADHAALVAAAQAVIDTDLRLKTTLTVGGPPNPLHWHLDRLTVDDPAIRAAAGVTGPLVDVVGSKWTLPFDGDMQHSWVVV